MGSFWVFWVAPRVEAQKGSAADQDRSSAERAGAAVRDNSLSSARKAVR